jgi:hypothetical protein
MRIARFIISSSLCLSAIGASPGKPAAKNVADRTRYPCREVHTFDFWVGSFDARPWNDPSASIKGRLENTREYEGCVIVENWKAADSSGGMSMSFYDSNRRVWRMVWIGDDGKSDDFEGSYRDDAMRFEGWVLGGDGKRLLASNVLENVSPDTIRHIYKTSADGGKTWDVKSDGRFVRRKGER